MYIPDVNIAINESYRCVRDFYSSIHFNNSVEYTQFCGNVTAEGNYGVQLYLTVFCAEILPW